MFIGARIISVVIGYVCGLFQTGYIYGKTQGIDIREYGSGNSGTTNTLRTLGWKAGIITFWGDALKCALAIVISWLIFRHMFPEQILVICMYAGVGTILGHNFPFYLKFKGGKGIACTAAVMMMTCPFAVPLCAIAFFIITKCTKFVSLGSIVVVSLYFVQAVVFAILGWTPLESPYKWEYVGLVLFLALMAIWRHRANIKRLANGTENPFVPTKKDDKKETK